jgi:hypothetical protein
MSKKACWLKQPNELVAARLQRAIEDRSQLQDFPQAAKDQVWTDPLHLYRFGLAGGRCKRWTPKTGPLVKIDFHGSAGDERKQIDESKTETAQWGL